MVKWRFRKLGDASKVTDLPSVRTVVQILPQTQGHIIFVQQVATCLALPATFLLQAGIQGRQVLSLWVFAEEELHPQSQSCQPPCPPLGPPYVFPRPD